MSSLELFSTFKDKEKSYAWYCWLDSVKTLGIDTSWIDKLVDLAYQAGYEKGKDDAEEYAAELKELNDDE